MIKAKVLAKERFAAKKEAEADAAVKAAVVKAQKEWETGKYAALNMIKRIYPKLVNDYNANTNECSDLIDEVVVGNKCSDWHDTRDYYPQDPFFGGTGRGFDNLRYEGAELTTHSCVIAVRLYNKTINEECAPLCILMKKDQGTFKIFETIFRDSLSNEELQELWK